MRVFGKRGFTLVEVMIAVLIISAGVIPVVALFLSGTRTVEKGGLVLQATITAQNILDRAKSDSFLWDHIPGTFDFPNKDLPDFRIPDFFAEKYKASGTLLIEFAPEHTVLGSGEPETNLIQLSVLINWIENKRPRQLRLITYRGNTNSFNIKTSTRF